MKHIRLLALLLAVGLFLTACGGNAQVEHPTETVNTTQETQTEETFYTVYSRPQEEEETAWEQPEFTTEVETDEETEETDTEGNGQGGESGTSISGGKIQSNITTGVQTLTWSAIKAFPIKSGGMSIAEQRKLCVDFFRFAKTAQWKPDTTVRFGSDSMTGGLLYGGLPYVSMGSGNVYRLMDYLDESTGVVNMNDALNLDGAWADSGRLQYFGNQCSYGSFVGWSRVINSALGSITARITKANGYIPLGEYTYDTQKIALWQNAAGYRTTDVVSANGKQTMYRSYAKLQQGDGLVYYTTAGHVIMCASSPHVEYDADGSINGDKSFITIIDQSGSWEDVVVSSGSYRIKSSVDAKVTFAQLFKSKYVPFTYGEFLGTDPVETTACSFSHTGSAITAAQLFSGVVTSNYGITDAYAIVTDGSGTLVYKHAVRNASAFGKTLRMAQSGSNVDSWGKLESGTYTVKVEVQLGTGERPTVYTGTLTVS